MEVYPKGRGTQIPQTMAKKVEKFICGPPERWREILEAKGWSGLLRAAKNLIGVDEARTIKHDPEVAYHSIFSDEGVEVRRKRVWNYILSVWEDKYEDWILGNYYLWPARFANPGAARTYFTSWLKRAFNQIWPKGKETLRVPVNLEFFDQEGDRVAHELWTTWVNLFVIRELQWAVENRAPAPLDVWKIRMTFWRKHLVPQLKQSLNETYSVDVANLVQREARLMMEKAARFLAVQDVLPGLESLIAWNRMQKEFFQAGYDLWEEWWTDFQNVETVLERLSPVSYPKLSVKELAMLWRAVKYTEQKVKEHVEDPAVKAKAWEKKLYENDFQTLWSLYNHARQGLPLTEEEMDLRLHIKTKTLYVHDALREELLDLTKSLQRELKKPKADRDPQVLGNILVSSRRMDFYYMPDDIEKGGSIREWDPFIGPMEEKFKGAEELFKTALKQRIIKLPREVLGGVYQDQYGLRQPWQFVSHLERIAEEFESLMEEGAWEEAELEYDIMKGTLDALYIDEYPKFRKKVKKLVERYEEEKPTEMKKFIKDFETYDPKEPTNAQLADDFRILVAWVSRKMERGTWSS